MARDTRKPVLYLRPFKTDEYEFTVHEGLKGEVRRLRAEALLLEPFEILGSLVAIGRPGEDTPPWGGAARQYVGDDWQSIFRVFEDRAQLAVLFAGTTGVGDADFCLAKLSGAVLDEATLDTADLGNADLSNVKWQHIKSLKGANIRQVRNAPEGFTKWAAQHGAVTTESQSDCR